MSTELPSSDSSRFCIAVREEFGYHLHLWYPPFPVEDLESKWRGVGACGAKGIFAALGGEWVEVFEDLGQCASKEEAYELFERLHVTGLYTAHICCDQDSHLITPDGRVIVHAGFDWKESSGSDHDPAILADRINRSSQA